MSEIRVSPKFDPNKKLDEVPVNRPASLDIPPLTDKELADALDREYELREKEKRNAVQTIELAQALSGVIPESVRAHWKAIVGWSALAGIILKIVGCF